MVVTNNGSNQVRIQKFTATNGDESNTDRPNKLGNSIKAVHAANLVRTNGPNQFVRSNVLKQKEITRVAQKETK